MSEGKLIGLDGKRIEKEEPLRVPVIEYQGYQFPVRTLRHEKLFEHDPKMAFMGLVVQSADNFQLTMIALTALAADMYSRQPDGSQEFLKLAESMGLTLHDVEGKGLNVADFIRRTAKIPEPTAPVT